MGTNCNTSKLLFLSFGKQPSLYFREMISMNVFSTNVYPWTHIAGKCLHGAFRGIIFSGNKCFSIAYRILIDQKKKHLSLLKQHILNLGQVLPSGVVFLSDTASFEFKEA